MSDVLNTIEIMFQYHDCKQTHRLWTDDKLFSTYACNDCLNIIEEMLNTVKPDTMTLSEQRKPSTQSNTRCISHPVECDGTDLNCCCVDLHETQEKGGDVLKDKYVPRLGEFVRLPEWSHYVIVTAVGQHSFLAVDPDDKSESEYKYLLNDKWCPTSGIVPLPEIWANIYSDSYDSFEDRLGLARKSLKDCEDYTRDQTENNVIAIVHVWTDERGVDLAEVIRK